MHLLSIYLRNHIKEFLFLFLFTLASILVRGYEYGIGNQIHYLTYVQYYANPLLYKNDYMLQTHTIPYTIFISVLRFLPTTGIAHEIALFLFYLIFQFFFYFFLFHIAKQLFKNTVGAWICLLFFIAPIPIGGSTIFTVERQVMPRFVADVFLLGSVYFLFGKKMIVSGVLAAVGFLFHPLTLLPYPLILLLVTFFRYLTWKQFVKGMALFLLIVLPLLGKFFGNDAHVPFIMDSIWKSILLERMPYIFLHTWHIYDFILLAIVPLFFFWYGAFSSKRSLHPIVVATLVASYVLLLVSVISDIFSLRLGLQLQLPRNMYLSIVFILLYLASFFAKLQGKVRIVVLSILTILFCLLAFATRSQYGFLWMVRPTDFEKTALWAKNNTPINSIFLVPADTSGFRLWSMRAVVNEDKEGGDGLYDRNFALAWDSREDVEDAHQALSSSDIATLKKKYTAQYIVTKKKLGSHFVFSSGAWNVYQL